MLHQCTKDEQIKQHTVYRHIHTLYITVLYIYMHTYIHTYRSTHTHVHVYTYA